MGCFKQICFVILLVGLAATIQGQYEEQTGTDLMPRDVIVVCKDNETVAEQERLLKEISTKLDLIDARLNKLDYETSVLSESFLNYTKIQNQKWDEAVDKMSKEILKLKAQIPELLDNALAAQTEELKGHCSAPEPTCPPTTTTTAPPIPNDPLRFDTRCAQNVEVTNNGNTLSRKSQAKYGAALTQRPLQSNELFEVRFGRLNDKDFRTIEFGVTAHSAEYYFPNFPPAINHERNGSWTYLHQQFRHNYEIIIEPYGQNVDDLKEGDRVGVMRKQDGSLHFFVNGQYQGLAATNVPEAVYGFADLYGGGLDSVSIVNKNV